MPSDKQNAEFMYAMLKQVDLKYIDWKRIAAENNITNGHAARMRFSRYRTAMEGARPAPRGEASSSCSPSTSSKARCRKSGAGKKRKRAANRDGKNFEGEKDDDDDEWTARKKDGGDAGTLVSRPRRRVKMGEEEDQVKREKMMGSGVDEDDVPIRLRRVKQEDKTEVKEEKQGERVKEERRASVALGGIPLVRLQ